MVVFLVMVFYLILSLLKKPFIKKELNNLETISLIISCMTIYCGLFYLSTENPEGQQVMYYKIPVDYEIQGNFLSYLKFRRALSKSQKVINFDKEEITTIAEMQGQILSKVTLSIVGLPDEYK